MAVLVQQNVGRLQVQVPDVGTMQLCQPFHNRHTQAHQLSLAQSVCVTTIIIIIIITIVVVIIILSYDDDDDDDNDDDDDDDDDEQEQQ